MCGDEGRPVARSAYRAAAAASAPRAAASAASGADVAMPRVTGRPSCWKRLSLTLIRISHTNKLFVGWLVGFPVVYGAGGKEGFEWEQW